MVESEHVRWVRYAADCAEHVLCLTGNARPQAEEAIRAARAWADDPTEAHRLAAEVAADASYDSVHAAASDTYAASAASWASRAASAAGAASAASRTAGDVARVAAGASRAAGDAARAAAEAASAAGVAERAWQAKRRWYYGLQEEE